ncbi:cell division topological specificity factor MinE [Desulfonispora thiosulfatigenes DSM 11270]|uniref:Cell division topological specificity factor n=1 Tax=Desulfonispora thiosulfatigenes DSM 11270 TaxID=656914 RepID=A0A1W1VG35_DESTI|nr:cell division topological specificity factor MinE [Desulfonispora thiosulfatigenes]SMB92173.1 cell division topological specificity factor MinE [Desulfonispora thiosulfatigenes DSM 11270]
MHSFLKSLLGKDSSAGSKNVAKERLKLVLVHDRATISPSLLKDLKEDLIRVISNYMEIDQKALEVDLNNEENEVALIANIPIIRMKRNYMDLQA